MNYIALKVERGYIAPGRTYVHKYCIKAMRNDSYNWEMLLYGFAEEMTAIEKMRKLNRDIYDGRLEMYNSAGYGIKEVERV